jgi:hypothetical protein
MSVPLLHSQQPDDDNTEAGGQCRRESSAATNAPENTNTTAE